MIEPSRTLTAGRLFETFIDRDQAPMPDIYVPSAKGVLIAGEDLLRAAGYRARSHRPKGWRKFKPGVFVKPLSSEFTLEVRQCGSWRSNMWTVERSNFFTDGDCVEALVCAFENVPIWATTYQGAMRMAEYCHPFPQAPVPGRWVRAWHH
jgi:hypothetical protein